MLLLFFPLPVSEADRNPLESFLGTVEHEYGAQVSVFAKDKAGRCGAGVCAGGNSRHEQSPLVSSVWQQFGL